jgi:hypothetical protein
MDDPRGQQHYQPFFLKGWSDLVILLTFSLRMELQGSMQQQMLRSIGSACNLFELI